MFRLKNLGRCKFLFSSVEFVGWLTSFFGLMNRFLPPDFDRLLVW